jgi:hypothetical protein
MRALELLAWTALVGLAAVVRGGATLRVHAADVSAPRLQIGESPQLRPGDVGSIEVRLESSSGDDWPLLLTPTIEGAAIEAVRGRLLRDDARRLGAGRLSFAVPLLARGVGTALLRIEVVSYRCDNGCEPQRSVASRALRVFPRSHEP